jgi:hypothetical protein
VFIWAIRRPASQVVYEAEELTTSEEAPAGWLPPIREPVIVQVQGDNEVMQYDLPVTAEQARALTDAGGLTGPLSFRRVNDFGITRATWNDIRRDLVPTFAEYDEKGSIILNRIGCDLLREMAPPLPHQPASVSAQGILAENEQHDTAQHTPNTSEGEGDTQESESENATI